MSARINIAAAVLLPPVVLCAVFWHDDLREPVIFCGNLVVIGIAALLWWPFSIFIRRKLFWGGLVGIQILTTVFFAWARSSHIDGLGWIFLPAFQFVGLVAGVGVAQLTSRANQSTDPTA